MKSSMPTRRLSIKLGCNYFYKYKMSLKYNRSTRFFVTSPYQLARTKTMTLQHPHSVAWAIPCLLGEAYMFSVGIIKCTGRLFTPSRREISNTELTYKGKCEFACKYSQRRFSRDFSTPDHDKLRAPNRRYY